MLSTLSPQPSAAAPGDAAVKDVTLATFVVDVIEASKTALVLVDFWATWCGPCKQLTPVLEKIARGSKGAVRLAKIDIDKNQPIAQQMGVQSVPSVFAFYQGHPIDGFAGALPEAQVKEWLAPLLAKTGGAVEDDIGNVEPALQQAAEFIAEKDFETAQAIYADILDIKPDCAAAYAGLVRCALDSDDAVKARQMLDNAPAAVAKDKALHAVRAALEIVEQAGQAGSTVELEARLAQNPADPQIRYNLAVACFAAGRREEAVDHLLDIVKRARSWNEDAARKQLVVFFEAMGAMDPLTLSARKRLSSLLFS